MQASIIYYPNISSNKIVSSIKQKIKITSIKKSEIIIVVGGDGFMLQTLKKFHKYRKPFYGINSGNYGFLMNKFSKNSFVSDIQKSKLFLISPLEMKVKTRLNMNKNAIAINEISVLRQSRQAASMSIKIGKKDLIKNLRGDGMLVSTPAGSTAYNLSVHGPILNLNSNKLAISPVSPFRPRRWRSKIVSDKSKIYIKNLNPKKITIMAVADNIEIKNVASIKVEINKKIIFKLLYSNKNTLDKKNKIEQLRKEIF